MFAFEYGIFDADIDAVGALVPRVGRNTKPERRDVRISNLNGRIQPFRKDA